MRAGPQFPLDGSNETWTIVGAEQRCSGLGNYHNRLAAIGKIPTAFAQPGCSVYSVVTEQSAVAPQADGSTKVLIGCRAYFTKALQWYNGVAQKPFHDDAFIGAKVAHRGVTV